MTTKQVLIEARRLIEKPESRCTEHAAEDKYGHPVSVNSPDAVKFCIYGAIGRFVTNYDVPSFLFRILDSGYNSSNWGIVQFNDNATHEEVLALFDRAIAAAPDDAPQELPA